MKQKVSILRGWVIIFFGVATFSVILTRQAHAYLDPGTGSYIFQIIAAGFFGIVIAAAAFKDAVARFYHRIFSKSRHGENQEKQKDR